MMLKPSLARKLNQNGYSPMHLACINGHEQLVRGLLLRDRDLVCVRGKEEYNSLHSMVIAGGKPSLLGDMLSACPDSIDKLTVRGETVLHLAVKYNQSKVFEVLVEFIKKFHKEEMYAWKDDEGSTVLHHAVTNHRVEMINFLFQSYRFDEWKLRVDVKDGNGKTAMQIVQDFPLEHHGIRDSIKGIVLPHGLQRYCFPVKMFWGFMEYEHSKIVAQAPTESRDALLVVLALVFTTSFQVGVNPPGGFWQSDGTINGNPYFAGTPILATTDPLLYLFISFFTMAGLLVSLQTIVLIASGMPMRYRLVIPLGCVTWSYLIAFVAITRKLLWVILTSYGSYSILLFVMLAREAREEHQNILTIREAS